MFRVLLIFVLIVLSPYSYAAEIKCDRLPQGWSITRGLDIASIEEATLQEVRAYKDKGVPQVPFGLISDKWEALKSLLNSKRELVKFKSPPETWRSLAGREGYAVLEDGCVIDVIITGLS